MKIVVVNGYVRQNKGDAALMSVLCQELQKAFPAARILISSQEDPRQLPRFEAWENIGSLNRYCFDPDTGKLSHALRLMLAVGAVTALEHVPRWFWRLMLNCLPYALRRQLQALLEADLVVSMGGGYLNGDTSMMAQACVYLMLAPLRLAKHAGACVACAPQSMGPFATGFQKRLVVKTLKKVDLVLAREQTTVKLLAALSTELPVVPSVDSGFLLTTSQTIDLRRQLHIKKKQLLVGVTVRRWLDATRQRNYERAVAGTIDHLTAQHHAAVVLIPQVTSALGGDDDRLTAQSVYANVQHKQQVTVLTADYTHSEIKAVYNALDMVVGTRFHSVIFSLTSWVPAVAIEYEHKTSGIMHDLGLSDWVVKIEEAATETLVPKVDALVAGRSHYKRHLQKVLPPYLAQARQAIEHIEQAYEPYR